MLRELSDVFREVYSRGEDGVPRFRAFLAGRWADGAGWLEVKSPIDLSVYARVARLSREAVEGALDLLYRRGRWAIRDMPGERRLRVFHALADLLERHREDFAEVLVVGNGKTRAQASGEVSASVERLRRADLDVRRLYGEYVPGDWSSESLEAEAVVRREPVGVVFAITPFNYPLFDAVNKLAYSAVAGNAFLLKPASSTPLPALMLARLAELAGFPREALAVVPMSGAEAEALAGDRRIGAISFTGSSENGERVVRAGGIKQYVLELGGGDPAIVLDDADPRLAASKIVAGMTSYAGQRCDAIKLVAAEPGIYGKLRALLVEELAKVKVGDPREPGTSMGPLISPEAADHFEEAVRDALAKGARLLYGGRRLGPTYVEPALLESDRATVVQLKVYREEVFAPVAVLVEATVDEAVELANGRRYGLDAAIFGHDIVKIRRAVRRLEVGAVYINEYPRHGIGYFPFGGRKDSGVGREGIGYTIEYVTAYKTIVYNYRGTGVWEYL